MIAMLTIICCMVPAEIIKFVSYLLSRTKSKKTTSEINKLKLERDAN